MEKKEKKEKKRRARSIWVPLTTTLLASTTVVSTGLAIYFALRRSVAKTYTITINPDGGIIYGGETQKILDGSLIGQIPTPFRDDKVFDYWEETTTNTQLNPQDPITHNMSIKAHWKDAVNAHTVTLDLDGGSISGTTGETITIKVLDKTLVGTLPTPSKNLNYFDYWEKDGTKVEPTVEIAGDITLKAVYQPITAYYLSGGSRVLHVMKDAGGSTASPWMFMKTTSEGTTEITDAEWDVQKPQTGFPGEISISKGKVTVSNLTDTGSYTVSVIAKKDGHNVSTDIGIVITEPTFAVAGGFDSKEVTPYDTSVTSTFTLNRETQSYIENVTFELSDETHSEITMTSSSGTGVLTINNLPVGTYSLDVIAKVNGTEKARKPITIVSSINSYKLSGGSLYKTAKFGERGTDTAWVLKKGDTPITENLEWSVTKADGSTAPDGVTVPVGVLTWTATTPEGAHELTISAKVNGMELAKVNVTLNITTNEYTLTGGKTHITAKTKIAGDSDAWTLNKDTTALSSGVFWKVTYADGTTIPDEKHISISSGKLAWTAETPADNYNLAIVASTGDSEQTATKRASVTVSLILSDNVYVISGPTNITVNDFDTTSSSTAFSITKDTATYTNVDWSMTTDKSTSTHGSITLDSNNKILCTQVASGTYTATITAKDKANNVVTTFKTTIVSNASTITIKGDDTINIGKGLTSTYEATVSPTETSQSITWSITDWTGETASKPEIDASTGVVTFKDVIKCEGTLTIQAKDTKTDHITTKEIPVYAPWRNSSEIWTYYSNQWAKINLTSACGTTGILITTINGTSIGPIYRMAFDYDIYLGEKVSSIPDDFLNDCSSFNSTINFPTDGVCCLIGNGFLSGCETFNQTLTLPNAIQVIGDDFLSGCEDWNNGAAEGAISVFTFPTALTTIGDNFLEGCKAFNQNLTVPSTITKIGYDFMYNCDSMQSTLTVNTDAENFQKRVGAKESNTLATDTSTATCYDKGIKIASDTGKANDFVTWFANCSTPVYRNLYTGAFETCGWSDLSDWAAKLEAATPTVTEAEFAAHFGFTSMDDFLGKTKTATVNDQVVTFKVIDVKHDTLMTGQTAALTFQLDGVLKDTTGSAITTAWSDSDNKQYTKSTLYEAIDNAYISSLQLDLKNAVRAVKKTVYEYDDTSSDWTSTNYETHLFGFTATELGLTGSKTEGTEYDAASRIINNSTWLVSPLTGAYTNAYYIGSDGAIANDAVTTDTLNINFGFCI